MSAVPKTATPLWPRLGLDRAGALDHVVVQYDRSWLLHAAGQVATNMRGPLRHGLAELLTQLADKPGAIKALNDGRNHATAPQSTRGLNVIVHYLAAKELSIGSPARQYVADAWSITDSAVKALNGKYAKAARTALNQLIELRPTAERTEVLRLIEADMRDRARLPWMRF